jgi:hypothetical protein
MGYLVMKTCKFDLAMLLLMFTTLGIWFLTNHYSYIYGFLIYCAIFIYLIIKHRPISDFFIVILFSVMSLKGNSGVFEMEYVLITILFAYTVYNIFKQKKIVVGKMLLPLICFLLYSGLSIIWTPVLKDGYLGFIGMLEGYLVYFILTNGFFKIEKKQLNKISKLATYVMLTLSVQIFSVYFTRGFERVLNYKRLVNLGWGYSNFIAVIFVLLIPLALYKYIDKKHYYFIYFIFDIFAFNRVEAIFANYSYNESDDDYTYIWNTFVEKKPRYFIVNHELIFFIKSQNNYFHKYLEYHQQVIFPLKVYLELLSNIGFEIKDVYFDFEKKQSENDSERIILVAKKCCT